MMIWSLLCSLELVAPELSLRPEAAARLSLPISIEANREGSWSFALGVGAFCSGGSGVGNDGAHGVTAFALGCIGAEEWRAPWPQGVRDAPLRRLLRSSLLLLPTSWIF